MYFVQHVNTGMENKQPGPYSPLFNEKPVNLRAITVCASQRVISLRSLSYNAQSTSKMHTFQESEGILQHLKGRIGSYIEDSTPLSRLSTHLQGRERIDISGIGCFSIPQTEQESRTGITGHLSASHGIPRYVENRQRFSDFEKSRCALSFDLMSGATKRAYADGISAISPDSQLFSGFFHAPINLGHPFDTKSIGSSPSTGYSEERVIHRGNSREIYKKTPIQHYGNNSHYERYNKETRLQTRQHQHTGHSTSEEMISLDNYGLGGRQEIGNSGLHEPKMSSLETMSEETENAINKEKTQLEPTNRYLECNPTPDQMGLSVNCFSSFLGENLHKNSQHLLIETDDNDRTVVSNIPPSHVTDIHSCLRTPSINVPNQWDNPSVPNAHLRLCASHRINISVADCKRGYQDSFSSEIGSSSTLPYSPRMDLIEPASEVMIRSDSLCKRNCGDMTIQGLHNSMPIFSAEPDFRLDQSSRAVVRNVNQNIWYDRVNSVNPSTTRMHPKSFESNTNSRSKNLTDYIVPSRHSNGSISHEKDED